MLSLISRGSRASAASLRGTVFTSAGRLTLTVRAMAPIRKHLSVPAGYQEDNTKPPMLRFQESLPKLPVPTLEETASRYLKSLHPILSPEELARSKAAVEEFIKPGGVGQELQKKLLAKAADPNVKNWMIDWWNFFSYLGYRDPVVPYVSYFYSYIDDKKRRDPVVRAAAITTVALSFKKQVDEGTLEPEYMRGKPLCMDTYQYMWNCCRIPAKPADFPQKYNPQENKHFIVIRKGQFFKVMHDVGGRQLSLAEFEAQFRRVLEMAKGRSVPPVGALTSENRDVWTDARRILIDASPENEASLKVIESASFVVCLDDASPVTLEERAHQYWHGECENRFYDKPLHFIINENGTAGCLGEHSMMDGTPTHRLNDYINGVIYKNKFDRGSASVRSDLPEPQAVKFVVTKEVEAEIERARKDFRDVIGKHELKVQRYLGYGKGLIKKLGCSPDAYVQMIIQLAYFKMYGKNRPTYESAATRGFQQGRTETCRSVSDEAVAFCHAIEDPSSDPTTVSRLFRNAVEAHVAYITAASAGKGVDRHFFGLKQLLPAGAPLPSVYADPAFSYSNHWFLSTSQLSSEYYNGYGWSQVVDDGFGVAYMINENNISFNIVCKGIGAQRFGWYLGEAADEIRGVLEKAVKGEEVKAKL